MFAFFLKKNIFNLILFIHFSPVARNQHIRAVGKWIGQSLSMQSSEVGIISIKGILTDYRLIDSMPRGLMTMIRARGWYTKLIQKCIYKNGINKWYIGCVTTFKKLYFTK